jgi:hypothetical protein
MKRLIGVACLLTVVFWCMGVMDAGAEEQPAVLSEAYVTKMDQDKDGRVSRDEFVDFGVAALKKQRKTANRFQLGLKFDRYDRNGDGYITDEDPDYKNPVELLTEKILGTWSTDKVKNGPFSFMFTHNGVADLIKDGKSFNQQAGKPMEFRFVRPAKKPTCVEIIANKGTSAEGYYKCIIEFVADDRMKLRMNTGNEYTPFPREFGEEASGGVLILDRTALAEPAPEKLAEAADAKPKAAPGVHRGNLTARVKVERASDRQVEESSVKRPVGSLVTKTTKKIKTEKQVLDLSVSNSGPKKDTFQLCWYFLSRMCDKERVKVYDHGSTEITLNPRQRGSHKVTARELSVVDKLVEKENDEVEFYSDPLKTTYGDEVVGYVALLKHGDMILDKKSHDGEYLKEHWLKYLAEQDR